MKFSTVVVSLAVGSASGFAPSRSITRSNGLFSNVVDAVVEEPSLVQEEPAKTVAEAAVVTGSAEIAEAVKNGMSIDMPIVEESNLNRIQPGRYNSMDNSFALPFMMRPPALDGSHAGDYGFDPLGFSEDYDLYTMQEAELRHARLAMLAVVGWPLSELVAPDWMLQDGCAPSVLNGFNPLSFLSVVAIFGAFSFFEFTTSLRRTDDKEFGEMHKEDMADVWKWGIAGDYSFDPLKLYSQIGDDAYSRKGMRDVEISHGRSAMLGITSFAAWEALTGNPIVENSMFFHPNLLLPALAAGVVAFNQVYELEESNQFLRFKVSSEGESRLENFKLAAPSSGSSGDSEASSIDLSALGGVADSAKDLLKDLDLDGKMEQVKTAYIDNVVKGK